MRERLPYCARPAEIPVNVGQDGQDRTGTGRRDGAEGAIEARANGRIISIALRRTAGAISPVSYNLADTSENSLAGSAFFVSWRP